MAWFDKDLTMKRRIFSKRLWRVWLSGGSLLALGGCGLSDTQLASIFQSAVTTGLNALLSQIITSLFGAATAAV